MRTERLDSCIETRQSTSLFAIALLFLALALPTNVAHATGEEIYKTRCSICHDKPPDVRTPPRESFGTMGRTRLQHALVDGSMRVHTSGLSDAQIQVLVEYLNERDEQTLGAGAACSGLPVSTEAVVSHWGFDHHNSRHQPTSAIRTDNVGQLELKWAFGVPNVSEMRNFPAVSTDTIFLPATNGTLYAIDRDLGCVKWIYRASVGFRSSAHLAKLGGRGVVAVSGMDRHVHLVDATKGELIWKSDMSILPQNMLTGSPVFHEEDLYIPVSALDVAYAMNPRYECCKSHGAVHRINPADGSRIWTAHMTEDAKPTKKSSVGTQLWGPSGAPVWTTPAIDEKRGQLYVGTGENTSSPPTDTSDSIIALGLEKGETRWIFQGTKDDAFNMACGRRQGPNCPEENGPDFDFGASPVLVTTSQGNELVVAGQKSGDVWALNPDDGKLVWSNKLSNGSALGGVHWGLTVVGDIVVVPVADPEFATRDPKPGVYALDLNSGELLWSHRASRGCEFTGRGRQDDRNPWPECPWQYGFSGAATSTNDVAFAGSLDGRLWAFDVNSGEIVWTHDSKRPYDAINGVDAHGGAIDNPGVAVAGNDLILMSGYGQFGQMPGNVMLVFGLN